MTIVHSILGQNIEDALGVGLGCSLLRWAVVMLVCGAPRSYDILGSFLVSICNAGEVRVSHSYSCHWASTASSWWGALSLKAHSVSSINSN